MRIYSFFTAIVLCMCVSVNSMAQNFFGANHQHISYIGRVSLSDDGAAFSFPGVQVRTVFSGTEISMVAKPNSGFFMVEIDNQTPYKIECPQKDSICKIAENLTHGEHYLTLTYAIEGLDHNPVFKGFLLPDNGSLTKCQRLPNRKIEFIGNSITCGYGVEGENENCPFEYSTENQYYGYAAITARELDAQCFVVARSGIGVYRNYNGNLKGDQMTMPDVYPYTQFGGKGEKWNFENYRPDVVCINLGTNDTSTEPYDAKLLYKRYKKFYETVRSHYPSAQIVLLSGPMLAKEGKALTDLKNTLDRVKQESKDARLHRFDFTPEDGSMGYGCDYHPSLKRQAYMAAELTEFLRELMVW